MGMKTDVLHVIETMYDVESEDKVWLSRLAQSANSVLGCGGGVIANVYDVSSPGTVRVDAAASGLAPGFFEFFMKTSEQLDESYVTRSYMSSTACALTSEFAGWNDLPFVRSGELRQRNVVDDLILRGWEPGGRGVTLNFFQPRPTRLTGARRQHLSMIASHLGAAYRLRRRLASQPSSDAAEAILDADGKVHHAAGRAEEAAARAQLRSAVTELEHVRGKLRASDPDHALARWKTLVNARWSLIDEFQEGSRRYIIAYANELGTHAPERLTDRERQVAIYAAAGHWTKLIAYHLGISDSTVRVLLARVKSKLGIRSLEELRRIVSTWPTPANSHIE